jgi:hypothetical protein
MTMAKKTCVGNRDCIVNLNSRSDIASFVAPVGRRRHHTPIYIAIRAIADPAFIPYLVTNQA